MEKAAGTRASGERGTGTRPGRIRRPIPLYAGYGHEWAGAGASVPAVVRFLAERSRAFSLQDRAEGDCRAGDAAEGRVEGRGRGRLIWVGCVWIFAGFTGIPFAQAEGSSVSERDKGKA